MIITGPQLSENIVWCKHKLNFIGTNFTIIPLLSLSSSSFHLCLSFKKITYLLLTHIFTRTLTHTHTLPWPKAHSVQLPTSPGSGGMTSPCLLWAVGPWEDRRGKRLRRGGMQSRIKSNGGRVRAIRGGKREIQGERKQNEVKCLLLCQVKQI